MLEVNAPGCVPSLTARLVESLAVSADVQAVLFDGARPLAEGAKISGDASGQPPAAVRRAVLARDKGSRFPGSRATAPACDVHHLQHRADGGDHHPDRLVCLDRRSHRLVHRHGWQLQLDPDDAAVTFTHPLGRSWTTLPNGTRLRRAPPDDQPPADP